MKYLKFAFLAMAIVCIFAGRARSEEKTDPERKVNTGPCDHEPGFSLYEKDGFKLELGGLFELEAGYYQTVIKPGKDERISDVVLAKAQLDFFAEYKMIEGTLVLHFEEDDTEPPNIDEAFVNIKSGRFYFGGGKTFLPLGTYDSFFISDPMSKDLGEARESVLFFGYHVPREKQKKDDEDEDVVCFFGMVFNGDTTLYDDDTDSVNKFAFGLDFNAMGIEGRIGYVSDMTDSDGVMADLFDPTASSTYRRSTPGASLTLKKEIESMGVEVIFEYLTAARSFEDADLDQDGDGEGDRPATMNVEVMRTFVEDFLSGALRFETSKDLDLPRKLAGMCLEFDLDYNSVFKLEALYMSYDENFSDPAKRGYAFTAQVAMEF